MDRPGKATLLQANEPTIIRTNIEGTDYSMSFAMNDDGMISIADAIYHFSHLFSGGPTPVAPFDSCGVDMTADDLGCESYGVCP